MQKIMFNERYGLNDAVLEGYKKNTRRAEFSAEEQQVLNEADDVYMDGDYVVAHFDSAEDVRFATRYKVGEIVAVAQSYEMIRNCMTIGDPLLPEWTASSAGWRNKMFVKAELMPHRIRITGIRAERLHLRQKFRIWLCRCARPDKDVLLRAHPSRSLFRADRQGFRPRHVGQQSVGSGIQI